MQEMLWIESGTAVAYTHPMLRIVIALAVLVTAGAVVRMLCEKRLVIQQYPEYRDYAARTRRMVPFVF